MGLALIYLIQRFFYRIKEFLRHWYVGAFYVIGYRTTNILEHLDRTLALKVSFKNIFHPLYQERNFIGYTFGFIFRLLRILLALIVYAAVVVLAGSLYLAWAISLIYIIYRILTRS